MIIPKDAAFALHRFGPESALRQTAFAFAARIRAIEAKETDVRGSKVEEATAEPARPGPRPFHRPEVWLPETVSGVVRGWDENRGGRTDGPVLDDGTEVRFPPHRAEAIRTVLREEARVEATGVWQGRRLHAYTITDAASGASVEAHEPPDEQPGEKPPGHTARFVVDHACATWWCCCRCGRAGRCAFWADNRVARGTSGKLQ